MNRRKWFWTAVTALLSLPMVAAGGLAFAKSATFAKSQAGTYTCPATGEELPCPNCCALNQGK